LNKERNRNKLGEEMKKLFVLVAVMALIAVMVVPASVFAFSTNPSVGIAYVSGNVVAPTITITPPPSIAFGLLKLGPNTMASAPNGGLAIALGSANSVTWQITAQDISSNQGHLALSPSVYLADELTIGKDTSSLWFNADGSSGVLTYTGGYNGSAWTGDALSFAAGQTVLATDPAGDGFYTTITFTATILKKSISVTRTLRMVTY